MRTPNGVLRYRWRLVRRALQSLPIGALNRGLFSLVSIIIFIRLTVNSLFIARTMRISPLHAVVMVEATFLQLVAVIFLFSFLCFFVAPSNTRLNKKRLHLTGASRRQLFALEIAAMPVQPVFWILFVYSVPLVLCSVVAPHPVAGLAAGAFVFWSAFLLSWSLFLSVESTTSHRRTREVLGTVFQIALMAFVLTNVEFTWSNDGVSAYIGMNEIVLFDRSAGGSVLSYEWNPLTWVIRASHGQNVIRWVAFCVVFFLASTGVCFLAYRRSIRVSTNVHRSVRRHRLTSRLLALDRTLFALFIYKELRDLVHLRDTRICFAIGLFCGGYMVASDSTSPYLPIAAVVLVLLLGAGYPLNLFGTDGHGTKRYHLAPVSGVTILAVKNTAYAGTCALQVLPVLAALLIQGDAPLAASLLAAAAAVGCLYALWGNISSVLAPGESLGFGNRLFAVAAWLLPFLLQRWTATWGPIGQALSLSALVVTCGVAYRFLIHRMGTYVESEMIDLFSLLSGQE